MYVVRIREFVRAAQKSYTRLIKYAFLFQVSIRKFIAVELRGIRTVM
jgi:hypothetical protein